MGILVLLSVILILLGVLAAEPVLEEKAPPVCKTCIARLRPYEEQIGLAGLILGVLALLELLANLPYLRFPHLLFGLLTILLTLAMGLIYGLDIIRRNLKDPAAAYLTKADAIRVRLLPYQKKLGSLQLQSVYSAY